MIGSNRYAMELIVSRRLLIADQEFGLPTEIAVSRLHRNGQERQGLTRKKTV